ncbi:hypothetical protein JCM21714_3789 [Gracilibacillus boraciitolerans JCM 21714]|uniref:DUF488 domain-containing protein n=1 Tax=Gracilibacillus boraciitolerans JCM 21714 TaxID=1298598 RepID=W4VPE0_9BACI|nr:DUF488 family protein [Gracilibacillus boraciitolerans]GAE94614.1 hypothetical protein JCM21714_3789 [Gracilibacillus boraciitolerans JCM 21714]
MKKPTGKLYTSNPQGLRYLKEDAELLQITRAGADLPNTTVVKELSPSPYLFKLFVNEWKGKPAEQWWDNYKERFNEELKNETKLIGLRYVYKKLLAGNNVVLICFCSDHRICHRKLVGGEFFKTYGGVKVLELNPVKQDQLSLF